MSPQGEQYVWHQAGLFVASIATIVVVSATIDHTAEAHRESVGDLLFPAAYRQKALALLLLNPGRRLHLREIARLTRTSPGAMARELDRLQAVGLLRSYRVGNQLQFEAEPGHPVYAELSGLLRKTVGLADILASALAGLGDRVRVAFVFGSMARGGEHAGSDIDLMVIGDADFGSVVAAVHGAQAELGREVNPKLYSPREWRERLAEGSSFLGEVLAQPRIFVIGGEDELAALSGGAAVSVAASPTA
jgi:predicted nucleotidyltransferase